MRAAAADVAVKRLRNFRPRGFWVFVQQGLRRNQNAGEAIAALTDLFLKKSLLQWMRSRGVAKAFNGDDAFAGEHPNGPGAAFFRCAIDQHHAAATLLKSAAEATAHQAKLAAQDIEQRRLFIVE